MKKNKKTPRAIVTSANVKIYKRNTQFPEYYYSRIKYIIYAGLYIYIIHICMYIHVHFTSCTLLE